MDGERPASGWNTYPGYETRQAGGTGNPPAKGLTMKFKTRDLFGILVVSFAPAFLLANMIMLLIFKAWLNISSPVLYWPLTVILAVILAASVFLPLIFGLATGTPLSQATRQFASTQPRTPVIFNTTYPDGYTSRVTNDAVYLEDWQAIARVIVGNRMSNFTMAAVRMAFPGLTEEQARAMYHRMLGALKNFHNEILIERGKSQAITYPDGWQWFKRVSDGMQSPLQKIRPPHYPQDQDDLQNTRPTHLTHTSHKDF